MAKMNFEKASKQNNILGALYLGKIYMKEVNNYIYVNYIYIYIYLSIYNYNILQKK